MQLTEQQRAELERLASLGGYRLGIRDAVAAEYRRWAERVRRLASALSQKEVE